MAAAHTKQLEDKVARYERIMSKCRRCKAALASEEVADSTQPLVSTSSASKSEQTAPKVSSTASALSLRKPLPAPQRVESTRSSKQNTLSSRPIPSARNIDLIDPNSSTSASTNRGETIATDLTRDTVRPSSHLSKPTTVKPVPSLPDSSSTQQSSTDHSLDLRPTSLEPSTSNLRAPTNRPYPSIPNPYLPSSVTRAGRPRKDPNKQPEWIVAAGKMLREVPLGWVWLEKLLEVNRSMLAAVATDTSALQDDMIDAVEDTQDNNRLLTLVRSFAHRHSDKRVNFQHFLLVCLCIVLAAQKIPRQSIVETLQICISDSSEPNINRFFTGAKWANKLICRLFFADWRYRAIDLLVIWNRSMATYGRISSYQSTEDYFVSHLTQSEYCKDVQEIPNRVHTTIPWIVKKEIGDEVSYETICKALCYSHDYFLETKNLHSSARSSSDSDIRPSQERRSISGSLSFRTARQSADSASGSPQLNPTRFTTSGNHDGAAYLQSRSQLGRQHPPEDDHEDSARRDPTANQIAADPQKRTRMIPDWSATPLGNPDTVRQRRPPDAISSNGELLISSSLGDSTPATQSSKRPLPDSPTSQSQPDNATRRRQHERERPSREEMGSSSRSGKKDSHKQRGRA